MDQVRVKVPAGRSPCGERGLKSMPSRMLPPHSCRSPCGERGLKFLFPSLLSFLHPSLPMRGAWIEIQKILEESIRVKRRSPCGERGLKSERSNKFEVSGRSLPMRGAWIEIPYSPQAKNLTLSLPMRGAWIEMLIIPRRTASANCRSPCGERGLKFSDLVRLTLLPCRSPCGERGLKYVDKSFSFMTAMSLPMRGAWIEIC